MSENVGLAMTGLGAGFSAMGSMQAGRYQRQVADYNASVAELQAQDAVVRGRDAEKRHRSQVSGLIGAQRASMAAQGQDLSDPDSSAGQIQEDTAYLGELDALTIRNNAAREAWGFRVQAEDMRMRGALAEIEGRNKAVGTILGAAGNLALTKYGFGGSVSRAPTYRGSFTNPYGTTG